MALLSMERLSFTYPQCTTPAVAELTTSIGQGEFLAVCGATGSGKSTFLRLLKPELTPQGTSSGSITFGGQPLSALSPRETAAKIGFVMQRPEQQIVTDRVWHELAFGLENLGTPQSVMARRIAEMACYFGIEDWYERETAVLSGGQKQLLNLAAVMVMQPEILLLDEPTAQLDPIAAAEFLTILKKLCTDFGLTIVIVEHRLEELVPLCDRLLILEKGRITHDGSPCAVLPVLPDDHPLLPAMPAPARLHRLLQGTGACPLTIREGRAFLQQFDHTPPSALPQALPQRAAALELQGVTFRYDRRSPDVLQDLDLTVQEGEIFCLLGGNGSGKSTALRVAAGVCKPQSGRIRIFGKPLQSYKNQSLYQHCLALLPQDVQTSFLCHTVREELADAGDIPPLPFDLTPLHDKHPYDLSGGEQQLLALAKVLALRPKLLLLDEPTKGLDAAAKQRFIGILRTLQQEGRTIVVVTHDVELAAACADRCALFFRGNVVSVDVPTVFFSENHFYTTAASRMTRGILEHAVTVEDIACRCTPRGGRTDA